MNTVQKILLDDLFILFDKELQSNDPKEETEIREAIIARIEVYASQQERLKEIDKYEQTKLDT